MRTFLNDTTSYSLQDRKRALLVSKEFIGSVDCVIASIARQSGTFASFTTTLPYSVRGVWAASLKSFSMPMNFGNILSTITFDVTYGAVGAWPLNFTLSPGYYYYSNTPATYTYADAQAHIDSNSLIYYILNYFSGALDSMTVLAGSAGVNWTWNAATMGVTSTNVPAFFHLQTPTTGLAWISDGGAWDLSGVKQIGLIIPDISAQNSKSNVVGIPNYFEVVPVDVNYGNVLTYEPQREDINWMSSPRNLSLLSIQVVDTATNEILPLVADWQMVVRFYVTQEQTA